MAEFSVRGFYDGLAADYHRIFPDWDVSMARQAEALSGLIRRACWTAPGGSGSRWPGTGSSAVT